MPARRFWVDWVARLRIPISRAVVPQRCSQPTAVGILAGGTGRPYGYKNQIFSTGVMVLGPGGFFPAWGASREGEDEPLLELWRSSPLTRV